MTIVAPTVVRLTRDAEVEIDDDPDTGLRERSSNRFASRRYEPVVRLDFGPAADPAIREMLRDRFDLSSERPLRACRKMSTTPALRDCRLALARAARPGLDPSSRARPPR